VETLRTFANPTNARGKERKKGEKGGNLYRLGAKGETQPGSRQGNSVKKSSNKNTIAKGENITTWGVKNDTRNKEGQLPLKTGKERKSDPSEGGKRKGQGILD